MTTALQNQFPTVPLTAEFDPPTPLVEPAAAAILLKLLTADQDHLPPPAPSIPQAPQTKTCGTTQA